MTTKAPWHLWLVGILAILWNSIGAFDYVMTQSRNESYLSSLTQIQLDYLSAQPLWVVCAWAIAIWSSVLGSALLLMRKKLSAPVFSVSLIGIIATNIYAYGLSNGYQIMGGVTAVAFAALIFIIASALYFYAKAMTKNGVLD